MRSVQAALDEILSHFSPLPAQTQDLYSALGRSLAQDVLAGEALPPFDNSSMDGYAVHADDLASLPKSLPVIGEVPAGKFPDFTLQAGQSARVMTGAMIPTGTAAIVPVEQTDQPLGEAPLPPSVEIKTQTQAGANIRLIGEDVQIGGFLLSAGHLLRPQDIGLLAGLGISEVSVIRPPRVAVLSTGDELLLPHEPLQAGKIRDMNSYSLYGMVKILGAEPIPLGIARDTAEDVRTKLQNAIELKADLILSSAGVSVGTHDVVKQVMGELGQLDFWKVNMRPGKPLAFGEIGGVPFFGLPGNPVSSLVSFEIFVRAAILKMLGQSIAPQLREVIVGEPMQSDGRESYIRVILKPENGNLVAYSTGTQSSGAISSLVKADALLVIPADVHTVEQGSRLMVRPFGGQFI